MDAIPPSLFHLRAIMMRRFIMVCSIVTVAASITLSVQTLAFSHCSGVTPWFRRGIARSATRSTSVASASSSHIGTSTSPLSPFKYLIYWRGEHKEGYSQSFRHWEFLGALSATIATNYKLDATTIYKQLKDNVRFVNAFKFDPTKRRGLDLVPSLHQANVYNNALQYVSLSDSCNLQSLLTPDIMANATKRCALIHTLHEVVADGMQYSELINKALESKAFDGMINNSNCTMKRWSFRREEYSFVDDVNAPRFGKGTTRSPSKEKTALVALQNLFRDFGGKVDLKHPEFPIYLLEGLRDDVSIDNEYLYKILCVKLASGARHNIMAPNARICKTTTPLCSIAAYIVCNIAMIRDIQTVLDPFAGSAAILLAASLIAPAVQVVGIEVAPDKLICRKRIFEDFSTRGLKKPLAIIEGDVLEGDIRNEARKMVQDTAFDVIVTDPPYGRRETMNIEEFDSRSAISNLIGAIERDRLSDKPLLKKGGMMIVFQPCLKGQNIDDLLPTSIRLREAGLLLQDMKEQRLNDGLSRWVVSFVGI